jgi:hypothetical protein
MWLTQLLRRLDGDARTFGLGYLVLAPFFLAPLVVARYLPGLDLPFHLSMADMLRKAGDPASPYAPYYQGGLSVAPYAAHYIGLRVLAVAVPLMTAHKLIVGLYVASFPLAAAALLGACGRSRVPALLAFPLAYNLTLHYGFVSFALSLPVLMLLLAALVTFLADEQARPVWFVGSALVAVLLFLCHLQNYLYGVCAAVAFLLFAGRDVSWRRRGLGALTLVPSLACLLVWHLTHEFEGPKAAERKSLATALTIVKNERLAELVNTTALADVWARFKAIPLHALRGFTDLVDITAARAVLLVVAGYLVVGLVALGALRDREPPPRMRIAGGVALAGALLAYFGLPHHLKAFELMTFYPRFAVLVMAFLLLVIPAGLRRLRGLPGRAIVLAPALVVGVLYGLELIRHYRWYDAEVADFAAVVNKVPPGGRAVGVAFERQSRVMRIESALAGLPHLYAALRPAPNSMTPVFYCGMRHMPCAKLTPPRPLPDVSPWSAGFNDPTALIDAYDYVFLRLPPARPLFGPAHDKVELLAKEGSWMVYGRKKAAPAAVAR